MHVLIYIPNIIGYVRILLAGISFYYMPSDPVIASVAYVISQIVLDWIDGDAARYFNQCSNYGAILDVVIDRCALNGLIVMCSHFYPDYLVLFQLLVFLNTACLMLYILSRKISGSSGHKKADKSEFYLVRLYYANTVGFNIFWFTSEMFFVFLYLLHFGQGPLLTLGNYSIGTWKLLMWLTALPCGFVHVVRILQVISACVFLADQDEKQKVKQAK